MLASVHTFLTVRETGDSKYDYRDLTTLGLLFKEYHVIAVVDARSRTGAP